MLGFMSQEILSNVELKSRICITQIKIFHLKTERAK